MKLDLSERISRAMIAELVLKSKKDSRGIVIKLTPALRKRVMQSNNYNNFSPENRIYAIPADKEYLPKKILKLRNSGFFPTDTGVAFARKVRMYERALQLYERSLT